MAKLSYWHEITEKRNFGKTIVNQRMEIEVDYDHEENDFNVENVYIYEAGTKIEVSKLLDKAEGSPLAAMLDAIEWKELYYDQKEEQRQTFNRLPNINPLFQNIINTHFKS